MIELHDKLRNVQIRLRDHADWWMYRAEEVLGHLVATRQYKPGASLALDADMVRMVLRSPNCDQGDVVNIEVNAALRFLQRKGVDMSAAPLTARRVRDIIGADTARLVEQVDRDIVESSCDVLRRVRAHFELRNYRTVLALLAILKSGDNPDLLRMKMVAELEEGQAEQALRTCDAWVATVSSDGDAPLTAEVAFERSRVKGLAATQLGLADDFLSALRSMLTIVEAHELFGAETEGAVLLLTQRPGVDLCFLAERFDELASVALSGAEGIWVIDQGIDPDALRQMVQRLVDVGERVILEFPFPMPGN